MAVRKMAVVEDEALANVTERMERYWRMANYFEEKGNKEGYQIYIARWNAVHDTLECLGLLL